jgi:uncharacterized protein HemY
MNISLILDKKYPGAEWYLDGDDYSGLTWLDDSLKPSKKELEALWPEVQYENALQQAKDARHDAYIAPNGSDAVFMKYQRGEATKQEWLDAVQAINDANPYPVKEVK